MGHGRPKHINKKQERAVKSTKHDRDMLKKGNLTRDKKKGSIKNEVKENSVSKHNIINTCTSLPFISTELCDVVN